MPEVKLPALYELYVTAKGIINTQEAIFTKDRDINLVDITIGSGQFTNLQQVIEATDLLQPINGSVTSISDRRWETVEINGVPTKVRLFEVRVFNTFVTQRAWIREVAFWAEWNGERYLHALAYIPTDVANLNNEIAPPLTQGIAQEVFPIRARFLLTKDQDQVLQIDISLKQSSIDFEHREQRFTDKPFGVHGRHIDNEGREWQERDGLWYTLNRETFKFEDKGLPIPDITQFWHVEGDTVKVPNDGTWIDGDTIILPPNATLKDDTIIIK